MESLLANYASSDEEDEQQQHQNHHHQQQQQQKQSHGNSTEAPKVSNLFSSLPQPKSRTKPSSPIPESNPKRIVQFKPPFNPSIFKSINSDDDDDEKEVEKKKRPKQSTLPTQTSSTKSLFSMLPAPKNSLGLGAGRRSIAIETSNAPATTSDGVQVQLEKKDENGNAEELGHHEANWGNGSSTATTSEASNLAAAAGNENYGNYGYYYGEYDGVYGYYDGSSTAVAAAPAPAAPAPAPASAPEMASPITVATDHSGKGVPRVPGKRGRDEIPVDILEVKQDELMKNRPREDQVKLTGIAFGPAYQPVSTKGKPSKLHKRKHQIGSLFYDMRQKEMELAERRARGFLTKAETQAKYGW